MRTLIKKNLKSWEECLPHIEFAYNRSVHSFTHYCPFKVVYGFTPLTPLELTHLPLIERANLDRKQKADLVKQIHEQTKANIERRMEQYVRNANQGQIKVVFEPGDWVWLHLRNERFLK